MLSNEQVIVPRSSKASGSFSPTKEFDKLVKASRDLPAGQLMTRVLTIEPTLAAHILKKYHGRNRKLSRAHVDALKQDIRNGNWKLSAQGISINKEGRLDDGQHRLTAISEMTMSVPILTVFGSDPEAFSVYDIGRKRTAADALSILDVENASNIASLATFVGTIEAGFAIKVTSSDVLKFVEDYNKEAQAAVQEMMHFKSHSVPCSPAVVSAFAFKVLTESQHANKLGHFIEGVSTGAGLDADSPQLKLRNLMTRRDVTWSTRKEKIHLYNCFALAWLKYVTKQPLKQFRFPKGLVGWDTLDIA